MKQDIINYSSDVSKFVDTAIKTPFSVILLTYGEKGGEKYYLSIPLTHLALDIEKGYRLFFDSVYEIENFGALKNRFVPYINKYEEWYNINKEEITRLFGETNVYSIANDTFQFTKKKIVEISTPHSQEEGAYKNYGWFKVGLLFATGEIDKLLEKHNRNSTQIAKQKFKDEWGKYRPYISDSITYDTPGDKNIFSRRSNLIDIKDYCEKNNIDIIPSFYDKFPPK